MPATIFNIPIRRDIIHNVFRYERHLKYKTTKRVKTVGDVAGSGRKPTPQKGTGRARQGNIRSSLRRKGGKSFGSIPKDFAFPINHKVRLLGMKSLLSSRLMENRIMIIEEPILESYKTKNLTKFLKPFDDVTVLLLTKKDLDINLKLASNNITKLTVLPAIVI